jgi:hypothetical protein
MEFIPFVFLLLNPELPINQLNHHNFKVRDAAHQKLQSLGSKAVLAASLAKELSPDPELKKRTELLLENYYHFDERTLPPIYTLKLHNYYYNVALSIEKIWYKPSDPKKTTEEFYITFLVWNHPLIKKGKYYEEEFIGKLATRMLYENLTKYGVPKEVLTNDPRTRKKPWKITKT